MLENTEESNADGYDFAGLRFSPRDAKVVCLKTQKEIFLRRNLSEFLLLLLKKPREIVEYREFREKVAAWTIYKDVEQVTRTIHVTKGELVRNLRLLRERFDLIEAVPAKGYRLSADVSEFFEIDGESKITLEKSEMDFSETKITIVEQKIFGGHTGQAVFASIVYAALFVVALFVEIAYQFDAFKNIAFKLAMPIFSWALVTSVAAFFFGARVAKKSFFSGFVCAAAILSLAAILLYLSLGAFLPASPITEANFQTYSAHAAYLKSVFYFLGLGVIPVMLPFVIIVRLEAEVAKNNKKFVQGLRKLRNRRLSLTSALTLSPMLLLGMTAIALLSSLLMTAHLFDNLKPNLHLNLFMQLVLWRWFLYFALAAECLVWYWVSLNSLRALCFQIGVISNLPAKQKATNKTEAATVYRS
jgi:DNA-binding winged helix-turn-helix (wHTH) protein